MHGHVWRNLRRANQHVAQQFPFGMWTFPFLNIRQALYTCEFRVEYKSKLNVWEIRDFIPKFPINMKCLWHIDSVVWRHGWRILNSGARNTSIQREAEFYFCYRSLETREELMDMSTFLQVIAAINMTRDMPDTQ